MADARAVPRWARKPLVVMLCVAFALAAFGATTQTWLDAEVSGAAVRATHLEVQGSKAATAVSALALVGLAGTLAAAVAGRIGRAVAGAVVVLAGAGVVAACLAVLGDPRAAAEGTIAQATGLAGSDAAVALTAFPALAAAAGGLLTAGGVLLLTASRHWPLRTKYDTAARDAAQHSGTVQKNPAAPVDEIDGWDRLTRVDNPTQ